MEEGQLQLQDKLEGREFLEAPQAHAPAQDLGPYPISATGYDDAGVHAELQAFPVSAAQADVPAAASATEASVSSIMRNISWICHRTYLMLPDTSSGYLIAHSAH
jgi:hypothetical protein